MLIKAIMKMIVVMIIDISEIDNDADEREVDAAADYVVYAEAGDPCCD